MIISKLKLIEKSYIYLIVLLLFCTGFFSSCNDENTTSIQIVNNEDDVNVIGDDFVSKADASLVSNTLFSNMLNSKEEKLKTRIYNDTRVFDTESPKSIKTIETLYHEETKTPAMYIINYDGGGFAIISATRKYYPILAYSENNTINVGDILQLNEGLAIWTGEAKLAIKQSETFTEETSSQIRNLWATYETKSVDVEPLQTRSSANDNYNTFFSKRMSELYSLQIGYTIMPLTAARHYVSESEYNSMVYNAQSYGCPPQYSIFAFKNKPTKEVGPLIGTEWHQDRGYNDLCPNQYPAGCVAIAIAQIMKFHKIPKSYAWANMPDDYGTYDTQKLVYDIGRATNMDYDSDGSSASIDDARKAFSSMGYTVSKKNHDPTDVKMEILYNKRPVYMRGDRKNFLGIISWKGHAWVCEGAREVNTSIDYFAEYQLRDGSFTGYTSWQNPGSSGGGTRLYFYLNWGWGPMRGNGWFSFNDVSSELGSYEHGRENLYISPN